MERLRISNIIEMFKLNKPDDAFNDSPVDYQNKVIRTILSDTVFLNYNRLLVFKDLKNFDAILKNIKDALDNDFYDWSNNKISAYVDLITYTDMLFVRGRYRSYYSSHPIKSNAYGGKSEYYCTLHKVIAHYFACFHPSTKDYQFKDGEKFKLYDEFIGTKTISNGIVDAELITTDKTTHFIKIFNTKEDTKPLYYPWSMLIKELYFDDNFGEIIINNPFYYFAHSVFDIFNFKLKYPIENCSYTVFGYDYEVDKEFKNTNSLPYISNDNLKGKYSFVSFEDMMLNLFNVFDDEYNEEEISNWFDFDKSLNSVGNFYYNVEDIKIKSTVFFDRSSKATFPIIKEDFNKAVCYFSKPINDKLLLNEPNDDFWSEWEGTFISLINSVKYNFDSYKPHQLHYTIINNVVKFAAILYGTERNMLMKHDFDLVSDVPLDRYIAQFFSYWWIDANVKCDADICELRFDEYNNFFAVYDLFSPIMIFDVVNTVDKAKVEEHKNILSGLAGNYPEAVIKTLIIDEYFDYVRSPIYRGIEENVGGIPLIYCINQIIKNPKTFELTGEFLNKVMGKLKFK